LIINLVPGPSANQAHFTADDVPELRQLIKAGLAKEVSKSRHPAVVPKLEVPLILRRQLRMGALPAFEQSVCVADHRPELVDDEPAAVVPDALLGVEDRAAGGQLDQDRDDEEGGRKEGAGHPQEQFLA